MRKLLLPVCAGLVLLLGALSASLWFKLNAERDLTADLKQQLTEATNRIRTSVTAMPAASPETAPTVPATPSVPATSPPAASTAPKSGTPPAGPSARDVAKQEAELLKDPEYRKARLAQVRMNLQRQFIGFADEMDIPKKEADRILDKLAELQLNLVVESNALAASIGDEPAAMREFARRQSELQRARIAAVSEFLGPRYAQFQQYEQTLPARNRAASINDVLMQVNQPLTSAQLKAAVAALIAEQQRVQQQREALARNAASADPEIRNKAASDMRDFAEHASRGILDSLAPVLNAQQLAALRADIEQKEAIGKAQQRMQPQSR